MKNNHVVTLQKRIVLPDGARAQLEQENEEGIQPLLNEIGNEVGIRNDTLDMVVSQALRHHGLPEEDFVTDFIARCMVLADDLSKIKRRRRWDGLRDVLARKKPSAIPPHLLFGAERAGVDLSDVAEVGERAVPAPLAETTPPLVTP